MIKVYSVFGTRPEAIKMAALCKELNANQFIDHKIISTGQHKEMLAQVFDFFSLEPDIDLNIMRNSQSLTDITCNIMSALSELYAKEKPDLVLVHGDTTSSMATTLASYYAKIHVGHVEAGLRTGNLYSPFPEEGNRNITGRLAKFHFTPTENSKNNLLAENIIEENIFVTGNTVIDSLLLAESKILQNSYITISEKVKDIFSYNKIILVTGHRRENFGVGFIEICKALKEIANKYTDWKIVYPLHLNPNVKLVVTEMLSDIDNVVLIEPLVYSDFIYAMKRSYLILTDSGGVQEEAPSLGKPVLVMRDTTERPEALAAGTVKLVGACSDSIISGVSELIDDKDVYLKMTISNNPYGDGNASKRILSAILNFYGQKGNYERNIKK